MNQNIKNNYTKILDSKLYNGFYYDFMLYKGEINYQSLMDIENMAIADFSTWDIANGILYSTVTWTGATNNGVDMEDIGLTGVDNGIIKFDKYNITNKEFLDIYFNSKYHIDSGDTRFFMTPVTGNTQLYKYPMYLVNDSEGRYLALKGGFYQGYVKLEGFDYQVLPISYNKEYLFHFELRPRTDYETEKGIVNDTHEGNAGTFFFMGTRAENKFFPFYKESSGLSEMRIEREEEINECCHLDVNSDKSWLKDEEDTACERLRYYKPNAFFIGDGYFIDDTDCGCKEIEKEDTEVVLKPDCPDGIRPINMYTYDYQPNAYCDCGCGCGEKEKEEEESDCYPCDLGCQGGIIYDKNDCCGRGYDKAIEPEFISTDNTKIDKGGKSYSDSDGHGFGERGFYEIETDNKFIMFNRTDTGLTTDTYEEGMSMVLEGKKHWPDVNYFLVFNRTDTGLTTDKIDEYRETEEYKALYEKEYNIYKDIRGNVFALKINEDGSIGYKYGVLNCDEDNVNHYEVKEEYSKPGIIKFDRWNSINIRFAVINPATDKCDMRQRKMRLMIYVNGFLVFISKELDSILMKALDDVYQKQESVPYNMSIGGGSIGLLETILPDYYALPEYLLPIEKDFCGTFIGDIRSFKIYEGFINYSSIANYLS